MPAVLATILSIVFAVACVAMVVVIMMQKSKDPGLGALSGQASATDTYWGRNKSRSKEGNLVKVTRVLAIAFFVLALVLNIS